MSDSLWENLEFIDLNQFVCIKKGLLRHEDAKFLIYREEGGKLKLKAEGRTQEFFLDDNRKSGWIDAEESKICFKSSVSNQVIELLRVLPINQNVKLTGDYTDIFIINEMFFYDSNENIKPEYLIEWIDNLKIDTVYPRALDIIDDHKKTYSVSGTDIEFNKVFSNQESMSMSMCCVMFEVEGHKIVLSKNIKLKNKGFIIYASEVDAVIRCKVREVASFLMGSPLVFYGYVFVNKYFTPATIYAKNIEDHELNLLKIQVKLPINLSPNALNMIDQEVYNNLIKSLYNNYDSYKLNDVFINYWIAVGSNSITSAVLYGAIIENIQKRYAVKNNVKYSKVINSDDFLTLKNKLNDIINSDILDDKSKTIFLDKVSNMNVHSQKNIMKSFCDDISMQLTALELKAWQQRNDAAHGNELIDISLAWRNTLLLRELVNKIILRLFANSKQYLSYVDEGPKLKNI